MPKLLFAIALLTCSASLVAQTAPLACEGRRARVRISEITPSGSVKGFMCAVAAHAMMEAAGQKTTG